MTSFVDRPSVPWQLPAAGQLIQALCELYPDTERAVATAGRIGIDPWDLKRHLTVRFLWRQIVEEAAPRGGLRQLVEIVLEDNPRSVRAEFLRALLAGEADRVVVDAKAPARGESAFIDGAELVTHNEALLFHDDLSLKIGRLEWLRDALKRVGAQASAVCKIVATGPTSFQNATGFLIGPGLVMTNWHVVESDGARPFKLQSIFGFDDDGDGGTRASTARDADLASIDGNRDDDWAVYRLAGDPPDKAAIVKLSEAATAAQGEAAFIIQHPGGETKRIAYARNTVTEVYDRVVHYLSDTMAGSSGSPVINGDGRIIALHHAGGEPQQVAGKPPMVKNEGIRIERIVAQMKERGLTFA